MLHTSNKHLCGEIYVIKIYVEKCSFNPLLQETIFL